MIKRLAAIDNKSISAYRLENILWINQLLLYSQLFILLRHLFIVINHLPADHKRPIAVKESKATEDELSMSVNIFISMG